VYNIGFSGAGIPTAGLASPGVLPFALRAPGVAAVPLAGHSVSPLSNSPLMTADGHVISPQALQLVLLSLHLCTLYFVLADLHLYILSEPFCSFVTLFGSYWSHLFRTPWGFGAQLLVLLF